MRRTLWRVGVLTIAAVLAVLVGSHVLEERSFGSRVRASAQVLLGSRDGDAREAAHILYEAAFFALVARGHHAPSADHEALVREVAPAAFRAGLRHPLPYVRERSAGGIGFFDVAEILAVLDDLGRLLEDEDGGVRHAAGFTLRKAGAPAIPHFTRAAASSRVEVRAESAYPLTSTEGHGRSEIAVVVRLLDDPDPIVRGRASQALLHAGPDGRGAVPALLKQLAEGNQGERLWAVDALASVADASPDVIHALERAERGDASEDVSRAAKRALAALRGGGATLAGPSPRREPPTNTAAAETGDVATGSSVVILSVPPPARLDETWRHVIVDIDEESPGAVRAMYTFRAEPPPFRDPRVESATGIRTSLLADSPTGQWKVRIDGLSPGSHLIRVTERSPDGLTSFGASGPFRVGEGATSVTAALPPPGARGRLAIDVRFAGAPYPADYLTPMRLRVFGGDVPLGEVTLENAPLEVEVPAGLALRVEAVRWPGWRAFPAPAPAEARAGPGATARATIDLGPALFARFRIGTQPLDFRRAWIWRIDEAGRTLPCSDLVWVTRETTLAAFPHATYFARLAMYGTSRKYSARFTVDAASSQAIELVAEPEEGEPFVLTVEDGSGVAVNESEVSIRGLAAGMENDPSFACDVVAGSTPPIRLPDGDYLLWIRERGVRRFSVRGGRPTDSTTIRVPPRRRAGSEDDDTSVEAPGTLAGVVELPPSVEPRNVSVFAEPTDPGWGGFAWLESNGTFRMGALAPGTYRVWVLPQQWTPDLSPGPHATATIPKERGEQVSLRPGWTPYRPSSGR